MKRNTAPRRNWPRIPVPQELFDLLIIMAKGQGYNERTLYIFIYKMLKTAKPEDIEKLGPYLNTDWLDGEQPDK